MSTPVIEIADLTPEQRAGISQLVQRVNSRCDDLLGNVAEAEAVQQIEQDLLDALWSATASDDEFEQAGDEWSAAGIEQAIFDDQHWRLSDEWVAYDAEHPIQLAADLEAAAVALMSELAGPSWVTLSYIARAEVGGQVLSALRSAYERQELLVARAAEGLNLR